MPLIHLSLSFLSTRLARLGPRPILLIEDPDDLSRRGQGQRGVQMHATCQPAGVDRAEFRDDVLQRGKVECGGVLHDEHGVVVQTPPGGLGGERLMEGLGDDTGVGVEPIGRLGLARVTAGLGNRGRGMFHGIHEDRGQPTLQTFIGQIGVGRDLLGPDGMGESHGSLHQSILKKFASSRNHTRLTNEKDTEKMWVKISSQGGTMRNGIRMKTRLAQDQLFNTPGSGGVHSDRPWRVLNPIVNRSSEEVMMPNHARDKASETEADWVKETPGESRP